MTAMQTLPLLVVIVFFLLGAVACIQVRKRKPSIGRFWPLAAAFVIFGMVFGGVATSAAIADLVKLGAPLLASKYIVLSVQGFLSGFALSMFAGSGTAAKSDGSADKPSD